MNNDYTMILLFIGSATTILTIIIGACYKSKCKTCSFCGINIDRDIQAEIRQDANSNRLSLTGIQGPLPIPITHIPV